MHIQVHTYLPILRALLLVSKGIQRYMYVHTHTHTYTHTYIPLLRALLSVS
jgi:hypothetical protein